MNDESPHDLTKFFTGSDLLLQNAFRLAQMPVDTTERNLNRRQQMIEMAAKMSMPQPQGASPIFAMPGGNGQNGLKEALHRLRDPVNRLFDELFWFWPHSFGASADDEGLKLLEQDKVEEAIKHWKQGEQQTENFVSTHNLALLHQFIALQINEQMISAKTAPKGKTEGLQRGLLGNKDERASQQHWKESFGRWYLLSKQDSFWRFLKSRIGSINDPRLPLETADWLRENISSILFSINADLIVSAAEKNLNDQVEHQRNIIRSSGFDSRQIDAVFDTFTRKYVQKIQHLCKTAEKDAKDDPINAHVQASRLVEQATPVLLTLAMIFPDTNKSVDALHDEVAEAILHCQVTFGRKTENWAESLGLLRLAQPLTRGTTARSRIEDNIKQIQELLEAGNNWCEEGYFALPTVCIDVLEKARSYEDSNQFDEAIDLLRQALLGQIDLQDHCDFQKHLHHCIAYCLKSKGVVAFNRAIAEYNNSTQKMLIDSIKYKSSNLYGSTMCVGCGNRIYGNYINRTIQGRGYPFCIGCNSEIKRKYEDLEYVMDNVNKESLGLMMLAYEFDPGFKSVVRNLKTIRETAEKSHIREPDLNEVKMAMKLVAPDELIAQLFTISGLAVETAFASLAKLIARQKVITQTATLDRLFFATLKDDSTTARLLPLFKTDRFILDKFKIFGLSTQNKLDQGMATKLMVFLLGEENSRICKQALDHLMGSLEKAADLVLLASGTADKQQADHLSLLIDRFASDHGNSASINFKSLTSGLLAASQPHLSASLLRLCEARWPDYDKMMMDKRSIRDLKYLVKKGNDLQRKTSGHILQRARERGFWFRFNIWQWRPSATFEVNKGQEIWWAR